MLGERAGTTGRTRSDLIREAVDRYLDHPDDGAGRLDRFRAALDATAGIAPYLPPALEYLEDVRRADRVREEELERRWQR